MCHHNIQIVFIVNEGGALFHRRDLFGQNIRRSGQMVEHHKYQMIQTQQPHGQEQQQ